MRCAKIVDYGERYKDGEVSSAVRAKIDAHLASCEACRAVYDDMMKIGAMFAQTAVPAVPEGMREAILEKIQHQNDCNARKYEYWFNLIDWWMMANPVARVAYSSVWAVLMVCGIYMGTDLWKNKSTANNAVSYDNEYPGINAFASMQPGSIEQTYFKLTSYGTERGER